MEPINFSLVSFSNNVQLERKIVHTWAVNDYLVNLIEDQGKLEYETINATTKEIIYRNPIDLGNKTLSQMIRCLVDVCKPIIDEENGSVTFSLNYHSWETDTADANLLRGTEGLIWNIFLRSTNKNHYFSFQEITIPSKRCHPETIVLIEKIKNESLSKNHIAVLRKDFKVTRILDINAIQKERNELEESTKIIESSKFVQNRISSTISIVNFFSAPVLGIYQMERIGQLYPHLGDDICSFFGGGAVGAITTLGLGVVIVPCWIVALNLPFLILSGHDYNKYWDDVKKKQKMLRNLESRIKVLSPEKPLFVEIEPISVPSQIDPRVLVSKFTWAVTLVTFSGSFGNHAEIVVEGINDGYYDNNSPRIFGANPVETGEKFIHLAHNYATPLGIESGLFPQNKELKFETRTEICMRMSEKVKVMLQNIEREKNNGKDDFNCFGRETVIPKLAKRIGGKGQNCFTWARDHLKTIEIHIGESIVDSIAALPKTYTQLPEKYIEAPHQQI